MGFSWLEGGSPRRGLADYGPAWSRREGDLQVSEPSDQQCRNSRHSWKLELPVVRALATAEPDAPWLPTRAALFEPGAIETESWLLQDHMFNDRVPVIGDRSLRIRLHSYQTRLNCTALIAWHYHTGGDISRWFGEGQPPPKRRPLAARLSSWGRNSAHRHLPVGERCYRQTSKIRKWPWGTRPGLACSTSNISRHQSRPGTKAVGPIAE